MPPDRDRPLRILTWHIHGSYLESLGHLGHEILVPSMPGRPEGYAGRPANATDWPDTIREVPADAVRELPIDVVLFQSRRNWEHDAADILSDEQRRGPRIYLEHDPPREHPTDTRHPVDDPDVLLVHVTPFNDLMWDSGRTPKRVIEHGIVPPAGVAWTGELDRGIVIVNHLARRGRRLGADVFLRARGEVSLDLAGMGSDALGGIGEFPRRRLMEIAARYRFYFHPIRYTSFGMAAVEAMLIGMPVVALATTEMPTVLRDGESGILDTRVDRLVEGMRELLVDRDLAARLGAAAQEIARERFGIERFRRDWDAALAEVTGRGPTHRVERPRAAAPAVGAIP
jgi:glycosyltransferase involved in cell wall biosynthesis